MKIRKFSSPDIETAIQFLAAMVDEMVISGGHPIHDVGNLTDWFAKRIKSVMDSEIHLFLIAESETIPSRLLGILEASIVELHPVFIPKTCLHINSIYVRPEYRRSGIARGLIDKAFEWGRQNDCVEADLNVLWNSPARSLYQNMGFSPFQIEMRRRL